MSKRVSDVSLEVLALQGICEVTVGADLAQLLLASAGQLRDGDVLAVSSKIVSKAAGLSAPAGQRDACVESQTVRVVAERRTPRGLASVVQSAAGPVMAAAGVDTSNSPTGRVLMLPANADGAARALRSAMAALGAPRIAVVITDTAGRPWRIGQVDFALGCAGLTVTDDLRGAMDASGTVLAVTERAIADEVAAAADLVKGKTLGIPAALVRGLAAFVTLDDGPGARSLLRDPSSDWFRLGHVEAVRASLGVPRGSVSPASVLPETLQHKAQRALDVALTMGSNAPGSVNGGVEVDAAECAITECAITVVTSDEFTSGAVVARLMAALWCEDLAGSLQHDPVEHTSRVTVTAEP